MRLTPCPGRRLDVHHGVPVYLWRILSAYFKDRDLAYYGRAEGEDWGEALLRMEVALDSVVDTIRDLGFKVATQKTQAMFHGRGRGRPRRARVLVNGVRVHVKSTIKYLGLTLDSQWGFGPHFRQQVPRVRKAGMALAGLMQTQGGPAARDLKALKTQARALVLDKWSAELADPRGFGLQTADAVRPCLPEMAGERGRGLSFHLVQVLTRHGCFGKYLHRIGKEPTTECHYCPRPMDSAHHTLTACEAWSQQRRVLAQAVGCQVEALSLPHMVQAMCGSEEAWGVAASFCRDVMSQLEAAEWERRPP
ncbi:uncharacterized protein LOC105182526 [Harpegnathos saltator]|uniref:uncharacterized protein LOC105182526 n=1 Tax=Harpegnathos saltator TaxID=610380 RepID=UPI000DBED30A|nr:uncharacterized protein LOC105182526 [Harpegnathos saltator]